MTGELVTAGDRRRLTEALGTAPETFGAGSIHDLSATPARVVDTARALPESLRLPFLRIVAAGSEHRWLPWFEDVVIAGGLDVSRFGRQGLLVPAASLEELLRTPVNVLLGRLETAGEWVAFPADLQRWRNGNEFVGAPAKSRPDLDYRWQAPEGVARLHVSATPATEVHAERRARRWLASRIAWVSGTTGSLDAAIGGAAELSADAEQALEALEREWQEVVVNDVIPGFRGPDAWYD